MAQNPDDEIDDTDPVRARKEQEQWEKDYPDPTPTPKERAVFIDRWELLLERSMEGWVWLTEHDPVSISFRSAWARLLHVILFIPYGIVWLVGCFAGIAIVMICIGLPFLVVNYIVKGKP